ncbi:tripartite tricarboxylate transporter TctB family protein [Arsenicitalea aurantiaca]|uniref:Tripartite tricarboxylate transporter TctB family protein n=1 Tax=Arsenicitalea aurantiaca TaxID=1783274 RepID=A0A433X5H2_9HYPH|nr:tripartite tricarboxylate transporter TctB family protein [Arsenicitalea aurantiaca]RUT29297.1 tripartite tricarboxylate transporter TctB family protein [Arsenicitalea aurantiaca]
MRFNDAVLGAVFIALALYMIITAAGFPSFAGQPYGASLFPTVMGGGFLIGGALLVIRGLTAAGREIPAFTADPALLVPRNGISVALIVGAIVFYVVLADTVGFIPIALVILLGLFLWFRVKVVTALLLSVAVTALSFWFFAIMLRVPLPRGWLTGIV